jgi:hypothetical protein
MAHGHYVVLFAGLMFRKKHATKHRGPVVDRPNFARRIAQRDGRSLTKNSFFNEKLFRIAVSGLERTAIKVRPPSVRERHRYGARRSSAAFAAQQNCGKGDKIAEN